MVSLLTHRYTHVHSFNLDSQVSHSSFRCCRSVSPRLCLRSVGIIVSVAPLLPTILTNTIIPTPSRGEDKCLCSCQGRTSHGEDMISKCWGGFWRGLWWGSRSLGPWRTTTLDISKRTPLTLPFFNRQRTEHLNLDVCLRTCNLNSFVPLWASLSWPRPVRVIIYYIYSTFCTLEQTMASSGCKKTQISDLFVAVISMLCFFHISGSGNDWKMYLFR